MDKKLPGSPPTAQTFYDALWVSRYNVQDILSQQLDHSNALFLLPSYSRIRNRILRKKILTSMECLYHTHTHTHTHTHIHTPMSLLNPMKGLQG